MNDLAEFDLSQKPYRGSLLRGFLLVLAIAVIDFAASFFLMLSIAKVGYLFLLNLRFLALSQLVYVIPLYIHEKRLGHPEDVKGIVIGASVVALLNAACWGTW